MFVSSCRPRDRRLVVCLVALVLTAGPSWNATASAEPAASSKPDVKLATFETADKTVRLKYPEAWIKADTPPEGTLLHLSPKEAVDAGKVAAVLMLAVPSDSKPGKGPDVKATAAGFIQGQKDDDPKVKVLEQKELAVAGSPSVRLTFERTLDGTPVKMRFYLIFHGDKMYLLQAMSEPPVFDAIAQKLDEMTKTLEWPK